MTVWLDGGVHTHILIELGLFDFVRLLQLIRQTILLHANGS